MGDRSLDEVLRVGGNMGPLSVTLKRRLLLGCLIAIGLWNVSCAAPFEQTWQEPSADPYQSYLSCVKHLSQYNRSYECDRVQSGYGSASFSSYTGGSYMAPSYDQYLQRYSMNDIQKQAAWAAYLEQLSSQTQQDMESQWQQLNGQYGSYY